jgi:hypothetical protein
MQIENLGKTDDYVYDISLDGTVVNALGMNIVSNTDGFNFQMPKKEDFRYNDEHPYISNGNGRNSEKGKAYTGVDADVAEFEDIYMCEPYIHGLNKMGLGIDEYCDSTINLSRKNYSDLMPDGSMKLVGNTIKSKKMPTYIEKFLNEAILLLLHNEGKKFLESYYDYVEKIYNLQIPLKEIASVGKIKTSISDYQENCKTLTAGGTKRSRQAWYELAIKDNLNVNMGDTIYYINVGDKKNTSDVQRYTRFFYKDKNGQIIDYVINNDGTIKKDRNGKPYDLFKDIKAKYGKLSKDVKSKFRNVTEYAKTLIPNIQEEDIVSFNCVRLSNEIIDSDDDHFCDDTFEYNKKKYLEMFNKKVKPLLVCFDKSIRTKIDANGKEISNILIDDPSMRKSFAKEDCVLVSGQPYNITDQDTFEQLMTMEDKEVKFWLSIDKKPVYAEECGMDWEQIKSDYLSRQEEYRKEGIREEVEEYNRILESISQDDIEKILENGELPEALLALVDDDLVNNTFVSKKYGVQLGNIYDFLDKSFEKPSYDYWNEEGGLS